MISPFKVFSKKPFFAQFCVTYSCNSKCAGCLFWEKKNVKELSVKEISCIASNLYDFGVRIITITGGEPFLRKDILEIIRCFSDIGFVVTINTNGILLDKKIISELTSIKKCFVVISLDTLNKKTYKKIRGVDKLDQVLENLLLLKKLSKTMVRVFTTVYAYNHKDIFEVFKFCKKNKIFMSVYPAMVSSNGRWVSGNKELIKNKEEKIKVFKKLTKFAKKEKFLFGNSFIYSDAARFLEGRYVGPCSAVCNFLQIAPDGDVSVCPEFPPFGNLKENKIEELFDPESWEIGVKKCYTETPCYLGCTRTLESLKNHKIKSVYELIKKKLF